MQKPYPATKPCAQKSTRKRAAKVVVNVANAVGADADAALSVALVATSTVKTLKTRKRRWALLQQMLRSLPTHPAMSQQVLVIAPTARMQDKAKAVKSAPVTAMVVSADHARIVATGLNQPRTKQWSQPLLPPKQLSQFPLLSGLPMRLCLWQPKQLSPRRHQLKLCLK